jgi:phage gp29-like protein
VGDFAEFLEIYGLPIIVGKYHSGASDAEKTSLLRAVSALGRDARAIMPEGMQLEIQKVAGGGGSGNPHMEMVAWADGAQSKAILGQVLSAEARATGMGSGVADLHAEVRADIRRSDARQIAGTLTRDLVYPLIALNRPGIDGLRRCPRWVFDDSEADDLALYADALPKLAAGGARIPLDWVHEKLKIPQAEAGQAAFGTPALAPPAAKPPTVGLTAVGLTRSPKHNPTRSPDAAQRNPGAQRGASEQAALTDRLTADATPEMAAWLDTLRAMLDASDSLEQFRDTLLTAYPQIDRAGMVAAMTEAFTAAHLWGMAEVAEGAD